MEIKTIVMVVAITIVCIEVPASSSSQSLVHMQGNTTKAGNNIVSYHNKIGHGVNSGGDTDGARSHQPYAQGGGENNHHSYRHSGANCHCITATGGSPVLVTIMPLAVAILFGLIYSF